MSFDPSRYDADTSQVFSNIQKIVPIPQQYIPTNPTQVNTSSFNQVAQSDYDKAKSKDDALQRDMDRLDASMEEKQKKYANESTDGRDPKTGKFSIFSIFKIVPIGFNIFLKFPKVMSGLTDMVIGFQKLLVNGIGTALDFTPNFFVYQSMSFMLFVTHVICAVTNIKNLHICVWPYLLDAFLSLFKIVVCSFVSILDSFILKKILGFPLYNIVRDLIEKLISYIKYPEFFMEKCYRCKHIHKNQTYEIVNTMASDSKKRMVEIITKEVPPKVMGPLRQEIRGVSKIASLFNL
jgi:hypothetical protein